MLQRAIVATVLVLFGSTFLISGGVTVAAAAQSEAAHGDHHGPPPINWTRGLNPLDRSWSKLDPHGNEVPAGYQGETMPPSFILMLINFGILVFILGKFGGGALSKYARKRHDEVAFALAEGARLRKEAQEMVAEYGKRIANVDKEIDELIAAARADAESEKKRIIAQAEAQAKALEADAERRIAAELAAARAKLEREVIETALVAATEILRQKTTKTDQKKLVETFIADVGEQASRTTELR